MHDLEFARALWRRADADLEALRHTLDAAWFDDGVFGFPAQQATEKLLKVWMAAHGVKFPFDHDLQRLASLARTAGFSMPPGTEPLIDLTDYAVQFRYGEPDVELPINRLIVLGMLERLNATVLANLSAHDDHAQ